MHVDSHLLVVASVVLLALAFDFINGFHDAANSIATLVSTRVLTPKAAVFWAAVFNFGALALFEAKVATTIGKGIIDPSIVDVSVIVGALGGAIFWNLLTWWLGLPSSSSHALVGGLVGAGMTKGGVAVLGLEKLGTTVAFIFVSPLLGMLTAVIVMVATTWAFRKMSPGKVSRGLLPFRFISAAWYSLGHGANDAQKTMGIIVVLLFSEGYLGKTFPTASQIPLWISVCCYGAMGVGTLSGGWRIVKTMGMRLTKLRQHGAFAAELGGAAALFVAADLGIPVSTTHTITGSILGAGWIANRGQVRWGLASRIVWAWVLTIPAAALVSSATYLAVHALGL
ncbi:MAG TPA: inorganic phosphate transporter [Polyangiaceae bacterium]|jgi:PiT family inorganic phosphate transporter|nr:inorganic phosphate transporter [Polyangiaceae bacterium]